MRELFERALAKMRRRPVRVAELILAAAAAVGVTVTDDVAQAVTVIVVAAVGVLAGEVAQTKTTPVADADIEAVAAHLQLPETDEAEIQAILDDALEANRD